MSVRNRNRRFKHSINYTLHSLFYFWILVKLTIWLPLLKAACERPPGASASDPFGSTHVTNMGSGITYRNYYCAVCNEDSAADLRFWQPRLECPTLTGYNSRFKNLTAEFIKESCLK